MNPNSTEDHLRVFFTSFPSFTYNANTRVWTEFQRLISTQGLVRGTTAFQDARTGFWRALVSQFSAYYGTTTERLDAWHFMCRVLRISPLPESITKCKGAVRRIHVNICDLIDCFRTGGEVRIFATVAELRRYTERTKRFFPKEDAKAGALLKFMLRRLHQ